MTAVSPQRAAQEAFRIFCTPQKKKAPAESAVSKKAEVLSLKVNDIQIRGYRWNHPSAQKILIIHGFESTARNFEGFITPLINKEYETVAFDAPAHGQSEGKQIVLPLYIATIKAIYHAYGPFDAYMAHSLGGMALAHFLQSTPHTAQTKAVLIAPATEIIAVMDRFFQLLGLNDKVRLAFNQLSTEITGISPEQASINSIIKNIHANILWLHDTDDDVTPWSDAEKIKEAGFSNIEFVVSSGLGHRRIYRDPETVNRIIHFL
ncbi:MAG: alpha/beta hydrolase [Agriterribacter sp.]